MLFAEAVELFLYNPETGKFWWRSGRSAGEPADNRAANLRVVSRSVNGIDRTPDHGVDWIPSRGKWRARISDRHLGLFSSYDEAKEARKCAELLVYAPCS